MSPGAAETIEIVGAVLLLLGYFGVQSRAWEETDARFLVLNVAGAALLTVAAWAQWRLGFAVLASVWLWIAVQAAVTQTLERQK